MNASTEAITPRASRTRSRRPHLEVLGALLAIAAAVVVGALLPDSGQASTGERVAGFEGSRDYIVLYRPDVDLSTRLRGEVRKGNEVEDRYTSSINGALLELQAEDVNRLRKDERVLLVERDRRVRVGSPQAAPTGQRGLLPWGLDRINQRNLPLDGTVSSLRNGAGVEVYVIDTGVDLEHDEFRGRINPEGFSAYGSRDDCNGHGTHVAGTVAGSNYGVAPQARITAIRVLDCDGSGWGSDVIEGIDWMISDRAAEAARTGAGGKAPRKTRANRTGRIATVGHSDTRHEKLPAKVSNPGSEPKSSSVSPSSYGSGSIQNLRPSPSGRSHDYRVTATVNQNICSPSGYCGWFPMLTVFPEASQCNSSGIGGTTAWVGAVQDQPGTQVADDYAYLPGGAPWRFCVYAYSSEGYRLLHEAVLDSGDGPSDPPPNRPANDDFANRQVLSSLGGISGSTVNATAESGEPGHYNSRAYSSIWYRWTAPANGSLVVTTSGSSFDTTLAAYSGSSLGSLQRMAQNDDADGARTSRITIPVTSNTTYSFAVDGFAGATGSTRLSGTFTQGGGDPGDPGDPGEPLPPRPGAVANMSLGSSRSEASNIAVQRAIDAGITMVAAAGNDAGDACNHSPASAPNALTVGATNVMDERSTFSNFGPCVDLFAPGEEILSAGLGTPSATEILSGTSMAAPHVAGAAALALSDDRMLSPAEVSSQLLDEATEGVLGRVDAETPNLLLHVPGSMPSLSTPSGRIVTERVSNQANVIISASQEGNYECAIGESAWSACRPGMVRYDSLGLGQHEFRFRGTVDGVQIPEISRTWTYVPDSPVITRGPRRSTSRKALFRFSVMAGLKAECKLDLGSWQPCASIRRYRGLKPGRHTFRVRQAHGELISSPTRHTWKIDKRKGSRSARR